MADPDITDSLVKVASHGGAGGLGGVIVGLWHKWRSDAREERLEQILQDQNTQLAVMQQQLGTLEKLLEKHSDLGERLALQEQSTKALHARMDAYDAGAGRRRSR
jgi:TolA-binding protein